VSAVPTVAATALVPLRRRPNMKEMFLEAARAAGLETEEMAVKLIENAARQGRSIIDDMIDSKQVSEEEFAGDGL
jgi:hypothetical protein